MALLDTVPRLVDTNVYSDVVYFGSIPTPGKATITSAAFERKLDIREPVYGSGGTVIVQGDAIRKAEVLVEMWQGQHLVDWNVLCRLALFVKPSKFALSVSHPLLQQIGLTACIVESVSALEIDEYGGFSSTIKIVEFRLPLPALPSKPLAAIPAVVKPAPTAQDAADLQIQALIAEAKSKAGP